MQRVSKFLYSLIFLFTVLSFTLHYFIKTKSVMAKDEPIPELLLSCSETRDNEFHSLRPYQAAPCGGATDALFCSNKLVIFEDFDMAGQGDCHRSGCEKCKWTCHPDYQVEPHNLNITLDESEFPIMGNTENEFDDATKLNEYASWYLNGVIDKKENKDATDEQIVNFSGPVRKLLPSMIQDQQRLDTIMSAKTIVKPSPAGNSKEMDESTAPEPANHDQIVIDNKRLTYWLGDLSIIRSAIKTPIGQGIIGGLFGATGQLLNQGLQSVGVNVASSDAWNLCRPPLPWDNGTGTISSNVSTDETTITPNPFESDLLYKKAYNEWLGKSCVIVSGKLFCFDNPFISNECADLWHYVPLSNNSDKKGKNYLLTGDGPNYVPSQGTEIDNAQHETYRNAPLYFAHTQEVKDLSEALNKTYQPQGYESEKLPETTEKIKRGVSTKDKNALDKSSPTGVKDNSGIASHDPYGSLDCSAVNVRVNEGDNLFPGDRKDNKELYVQGAQYLITEAECNEENWFELVINEDTGKQEKRWHRSFKCPAEVGIEFKLGTKTPYANEIFSETVADSGSTFRKIFPKVEKGAPVECIADIPTTTNVTYSIDNPINQAPNGGEQTFKQTVYPADGANSETQLTFPHIGSVYEYFLKGIQTALRPKGYGEPIANGNCKPAEKEPETGECKQWLFEKDKNGRYYYDKVIAAATSVSCNRGKINPAWALGIALNETGGLMSDAIDGSGIAHFGVRPGQMETIEDKLTGMVNTLIGTEHGCKSGWTDTQILQSYGYPDATPLWPVTILSTNTSLFGSNFDIESIKKQLLSTDWFNSYKDKANLLCPNSPTLVAPTIE